MTTEHQDNGNILQRLSAVMRAVEYVQKDASINNRYTALSHDKLTGKLRGHFVDNGIIVCPSLTQSRVSDTGTKTKLGTPIIRYEATYNVRFLNIDKPDDKLEMSIEAHANDEGDKAPGKAISYATKYAMLKVLSIESGDKEEERIEAHVQAYSDEHKLIFDVAITEADSFSLVALMGLLSDDAQAGLFNSFEPGSKTSGKETVRKLQKEGLEVWVGQIVEIESMIHADDGMGLKQAVDELSLHEKHYLAKRIGADNAQAMGKLIKDIKDHE
jgi:hypothetical protein